MRAAAGLKFAIVEESSRWTVKDIALLLLGAVISFYATVVFERYKRFGEMLRDTARSRELSLEYPPYSKSTVHLEIAYRQMESFREELAKTTWSLEVDGHLGAARKLAHLQSFVERAARCVDGMINERTGNLTTEEFLDRFKAEYKRIFEANFQSFEERLQPNWGALLQPYPHRTLPVSRVTNEFDYFFDYFKDLLSLPAPPLKLRL